MKKLKFKSLTMRIWATFTAVILIIICSISVLYLFAYKRISENAMTHDLKVAHDVLLNSDNFNEPPRFDEMKNLRGIGHFVVVINKNNEPQINDVGKRKEGQPSQVRDGKMLPGNSRAEKLWMSSFIKADSMNDQEFSGYYSGVKYNLIISTLDNGSSGKAYLISYIPHIQDNSVLYTVILIGMLFIGIGFVTAKMVANRISKPLKDLEKHTLRIAQKDWKEPIVIKNEDEIGRLAAAMNHMQRELKRADEEEKMFLQSISHDLKTPVMVIMSHAEAILDGVYIDSVEKTAEIIKEEAVSLERKIKQLLYLNTLDYVLENNNEEEEFEINRLLMHIVNRFELVNSKLDWDLDIDKLTVRGNKEKLQVALENIVENGLRYAKEQIKITLKQEGNFALVNIYNDGSKIEEKHIDHIFDNHYKDKTGNFGLGLAITKKIIDFYRGEIKAINREKGVSFIIKYPIF